MEVYGIIYMIRNKINNKIYFGQTVQLHGFQDRYKHGDITFTHNDHLKNSVIKYGIENFEIREEFDIAYFTSTFLPSFGTISKSHSSSGTW